ncbi:MAG: hypothetical protein JWL77_359 [Chthonomonadaceae bacterium]|nr:hypothetical protein [Chthonomonadaceae bacterium]
MAHTIYATFLTEHDAEKAAGALLDHGIATQDIGFILPHSTLATPVDAEGHPSWHQAPLTHAVEAAPPAQVPLPGQVPLANAQVQAIVPPVPVVPEVPLTYREIAQGDPKPGYRYDALGAEIPDNTPLNTISSVPPLVPVTSPEAASIAALPATTSEDTLRYEDRPHVLDMNRDEADAASGITTTTGADAAKGVLGGAGIGVGLGILLGMAAVAIPGVGWVAGAGMLVTGLALATGAAGGIAGGVAGYLVDLGVPEDKARLLNTHLEAGSPVLSINVTGKLTEFEIEEILRKYGATAAEAF